jgi:hypothetical protein
MRRAKKKEQKKTQVEVGHSHPIHLLHITQSIIN